MEKIDRAELESWKNKFENYLNEHPSNDGSHDISHFKRVWRLADRLSSNHEDKLVILAACYFHDIVNYPKNDSRRSQSSKDAALKAKEILLNMNFPQDKLDKVAHCIEAHSYSANIQPETLEAEIVQDSDRMESLGAIGLARTFYVSGRMGGQLFNADDPFAENRVLNDSLYAVDHFKVKLFKLPETMKTKAGKEEAIHRAKILEQFLNDLKDEL
jgi:uncharacterized protein